MDGLEELQQLTMRAQRSAAEARRATSGGTGSPIEVRLAQAFEDTSAALEKMAVVQAGIAAQQKEIKDAITQTNANIAEQNRAIEAVADTVDRASETIWFTSQSVADAYLRDYCEHIDGLKTKADETIDALEKLGGDKAKEYGDAVDASVSKLYRSTAFSAALLFCMCLVGGALAAIGAWWSLTAWPWLADFASKYGIWIAGVAAAVIFIVYCVVTRKK